MPNVNSLLTVEDMWKKSKGSIAPAEGYFLRVKVGPRDLWKDKDCPFRTNMKLRLQSIPTLIRWGTVKRLADNFVQNHENVQMLMEEED
jgi:hypothetical protein